MKKLLTTLMLLALFVSCSSDDDNTDPNNGNNNGMIDEKILGKWKVEYSKTIKGAHFLEDGTLEIGKDSEIVEYMGDYTGHIDQTPKSGIFDNAEFKIDISMDNKIIASPAGKNNKTINYKIEGGLLKWISSVTGDIQEHKYKIENNKLTIERIPTDKNRYWYAISEYSRIIE